MMKTLYAYRKVLNGQEIIDWAKKAGFPATLKPEDLHVTIAYSKDKVDWDKLDRSTGQIRNQIQNRELKILGEDAIVLKFKSKALQREWQEFRDAGASWDWPEYQSHITLTYNGNGFDFSNIQPYRGDIVLGSQHFEELDENWEADES